MTSEIHVYRGVRGVSGIRVTVDGLRLLEHELVWRGSAEGADRGQREVEMTDLAYAILSYELGELAAEALHLQFRRFIRARLPLDESRREWKLTGDEIRRWYAAQATASPASVLATPFLSPSS